MEFQFKPGDRVHVPLGYGEYMSKSPDGGLMVRLYGGEIVWSDPRKTYVVREAGMLTDEERGK